ncbi:MAG: hypothetical protein SchgKO_22070 [Schleiferiaceae bacterium]
MGFIPQEAKDKIARLEAENKKLKEAENNAETKVESPKNSPLPGILGLGWLLTAAYLVYVLFFSTSTVVEPTEIVPRDSLIVYKDGLLKKVDQVPDDGLVYRVQIGAFEGPQWEVYKSSFDNLHAYGKVENFEKISIGAFTRLEDAQHFQQMLSTLGMEFAYIVAYLDGKPIGLTRAKTMEPDTSNEN